MNVQVGNQQGVVGNQGFWQGLKETVTSGVTTVASGIVTGAKQSLEFCLKNTGKIGTVGTMGSTALVTAGVISNPFLGVGVISVGGVHLVCKALSYFNTGTILPPNRDQITPMANIGTAAVNFGQNNINLSNLLGLNNNPLTPQDLQTLTAFSCGAHIVFGAPPPPVAAPPPALVGVGGLVANSANGTDLTSHYTNRQGHRLNGNIQIGQTNKSTAILIGQTDDGRTYVQLEGHGTHGLWNSIGHGLDYITHVNNDYLQIGPMGSCPYSEKQGNHIVL